MKDIWKCIKIVQNPEATSIRKLKIEIDGQKIEDPQKLANEFSEFFVEKVRKLEAGIKRTNIDPLSLLKEKMKPSNITFTIKTVNVSVVQKILKDLKAKRSYGHDGITSEDFHNASLVLMFTTAPADNTAHGMGNTSSVDI